MEVWNDEVLKEAEIWTINERLTFKNIYIMVNDYCYQNNLAFGDQMAINVISGLEAKENFKFVVYGDNIFPHANHIANIIDKKIGDKHIISLKTIMANQKYSIFLDTRIFYEFVELKKVKNINPLVMVSPIKVSFLESAINIISPETLLIPLYRKLYSPEYAGDWQNLFKSELILINYLTARKTKIIGNKEFKKRKKSKRDEILIYLIEKFKHDKTKIFIGDFVINYLLEQKNHINFLELISSQSEVDDIYSITQELKEKFNVPIESHIRELFIIEDFRIKRLTFKFGEEGNKKEILYIYNSAKYELIPYNIMNGFRIGSPFVLMRFVLINIWMLRWVSQMNKIDESFLTKKITNSLNLVFSLRTKLLPEGELLGTSSSIAEKYLDTDSSLAVFQKKRYLGIRSDEIIAQKLIMTQLPVKFREYFPKIALTMKGEYREI